MNQRFRLLNLDIFKACTDEILARFTKSDKPVNVIITDDDETRSHAQNRLYWLWLTQIGDAWGQDKDSLHIDFKRRFLSRIYLRDGTDTRLNDCLPSLQIVKQTAGTAVYEAIAQQIASGISTTKASTKQMTEYLNDIYAFCYGRGLLLQIPSDLEWVCTKS
ncbi:hypothetical protein B0181_11480 [Moraxella caviae]|uniref:NinB protein n=1 Tax=Moraxella caviae TaxID=34060 RepID=A0A1S9ZTE8_9GAMM|nr:hypothetical protein [Moraxella caviae]OOR86785.1 hypothetical protein B0181_11480 [Moraxella caviae]STZ14033.1 NinB protein [Moraxella caviae]STZ14504.1 NinB protein [Moraxella caviae]VEW11316.1 NinB protein [Moraxella caviae]VEW12831.1 NinB protein [Moraxella caviae]